MTADGVRVAAAPPATASPAAITEGPCGPKVGRPRSAAADTAILDATVDLFADLGFEGVSIEAVAERAGVAKSTVYRRYPAKIDLVMAAWQHGSPAPEPPTDTGSLLDDLVACAEHLRAVFTESPIGRAIPSAMVAAARFPEFNEAHHAFVRNRRAPMLAKIEASVAAGELRADTDAQLLIDLIAGPIFSRAFNTGGSLADDQLRTIVEHALASFR